MGKELAKKDSIWPAKIDVPAFWKGLSLAYQDTAVGIPPRFSLVIPRVVSRVVSLQFANSESFARHGHPNDYDLPILTHLTARRRSWHRSLSCCSACMGDAGVISEFDEP